MLRHVIVIDAVTGASVPGVQCPICNLIYTGDLKVAQERHSCGQRPRQPYKALETENGRVGSPHKGK